MKKLLTLAGLVLPVALVLVDARAAAEGTEKPKLDLPDVKGWDRTPPRKLPPESGGYSVAYNSPAGTAVTVYVYDRGRSKIPSDLSDEIVKQEWEGARAAVHQLRRPGGYDSVEEESAGERTLGGRKDGRKTLYARFRVALQGQKGTSELYVLPYRDRFIKIRITRRGDAGKAEADRLDALFAALGQALK
jgi:hypothetical protein